jgi:tRNA(fMet)-specific endonuclease VapC
MSPSLLDTDILSELLKQKNPIVAQKAGVYLAQYGQFAFSALTRYEVLRGLKDRQAIAQLQKFAVFCQQSMVLPMTDAVLERAADLWVLAGQQGRSRSDADLIIASTAIEHGLTLVSGNIAHFGWIPGLIVEDWRRP